MDDFTFSLAAGAAVSALALLLFSPSGFSLAAFIFLLALSQAGFFARSALLKSGFAPKRAEYMFIAAVVACFFAAALSLGVKFGEMTQVFPVPLALCAAPAALLSKHYFS